MIDFSNLSFSRAIKLLVKNANGKISAGEKIGLVGENGCGKSSFFALLRGEISADSGDLNLQPNLKISFVKQETPSLNISALDYVLDGHKKFREAEKLLKEAEILGDGLKISKAYEIFENLDGYAQKAKAAELLAGLGFEVSSHNNLVSSFSGGWRMRLNLAQALIAPSDLLLLDEPTNHLDLDAISWLQDFLKSQKNTQIIIAHDREFLDGICKKIISIENQQMHFWSGNYSQFEKLHAEKIAQLTATYQAEQRKRKHLESFVERFRYKATKAKQAQSRLKALEKLNSAPPPAFAQPFSLRFLAPESTPELLLTLKKAVLGYGEKTVLKDLKLEITSGDRIGLLGKNGAGKSTLIKALAGELALISGSKNQHQNCKIGYFAQHQLDSLEIDKSPEEHLQKIRPDLTSQEMRNFLGAYGFGGDKFNSPVKPFSGGEKARLALALIIAQKPNLLLLDEPTNHLDLMMRDELTLALQDFAGAIIVVAHDRNLLRNTCDKFLLINSGTCEEYLGDLDDYLSLIKQRENLEKATKSPEKLLRLGENEKRKNLKNLEKALEKAERKLEKINSELKKVEEELANNELYQPQNSQLLENLLSEQSKLKEKSEKAEEIWFLALENLEKMK